MGGFYHSTGFLDGYLSTIATIISDSCCLAPYALTPVAMQDKTLQKYKTQVSFHHVVLLAREEC